MWACGPEVTPASSSPQDQRMYIVAGLIIGRFCRYVNTHKKVIVVMSNESEVRFYLSLVQESTIVCILKFHTVFFQRERYFRIVVMSTI